MRTPPRTRAARPTLAAACSALLLLLLPGAARPQQGLGPFERDSARDMLQAMRDDLKKNYYDPALRGVDLDARFKEAEERIKHAQTRDQLIAAVAQFVLELNDSHTFFLPPFRAARVTYGWKMQMFGDDCVVTDVNPASDAARKGLKAGDVVLAVDGHRPARDILWKMHYRYYVLMPARAVRLRVRSPGETQARDIEALSKVEKTAVAAQFYTNIFRYNSELRVQDDRFHETGDAVVWRMPTFVVSPEHIDEMMGRVRKARALILDLRGNGGGYVVALERLVGHLLTAT